MDVIRIARTSLWNLYEVVTEYRVCRDIRFSEPPTVLDVGAHAGIFALYAMDCWRGARVECYEPHPETCALLRSNLEGLPAIVHEAAIVGANAPVEMTLYEGKQTRLACSLKLGRSQRDDGVRVTTMSAAELPGADVVKCDTESSEIPILETYFATHENALPAVVLYEWHSPADREELARMMKSRGYTSVDEVVAGSCGTQVWMKGEG